MASLKEQALLAQLRIGVWSGNMYDQDVTEEIGAAHKADAKQAGRYNKRLVAQSFLKPVHGAASAWRRVHNILTLPWEDNGARILATSGYMIYTQKMRDCRLKYEAEVKAFIPLIPQAQKEAEVRLGTMYDAEDYPSEKDLKAKFWSDVEVKGVPEAGDFRAQLSNDTMKAIVQDIEARSNDRVAKAMNDVFLRVHGAVEKMAVKLKEFKPPVKDEKGKNKDKGESGFKDSLVYNIFELAELLPALNITGDKRLDELQQQLQNELVEHSPEILRSDAKIRAQVANRAEKLLKKVEQYMA